MIIKIPVSVGELIDKITILEIKKVKIKDKKKLLNVTLELKLLNNFLKKNNLNKRNLKKLKDDLFKTNSKLWVIEDKLRNHELKNKFDSIFIKHARQVYFLNDKRSVIKKNINESVGSTIVEEKSYQDYK